MPPVEALKPAPLQQPVSPADEPEPPVPAPIAAAEEVRSPAPARVEPPKEKDYRDTATKRLNFELGIVKNKDQFPERYRQTMASLDKKRGDGPPKTVRISAARLASYEQDHPREAADFLNATGAVETYDEALEKGGDVVIPYDAFIHHAADLPARDDLIRDLRFAPGQRTSREAEAERKHREPFYAYAETAILARGSSGTTKKSAEAMEAYLATKLPGGRVSHIVIPGPVIAAFAKNNPEAAARLNKTLDSAKSPTANSATTQDLHFHAEPFFEAASTIPAARDLL
jgi:hypothetical protein